MSRHHITDCSASRQFKDPGLHKSVRLISDLGYIDLAFGCLPDIVLFLNMHSSSFEVYRTFYVGLGHEMLLRFQIGLDPPTVTVSLYCFEV